MRTWPTKKNVERWALRLSDQESIRLIREIFGFSQLDSAEYPCKKCKEPMKSQTIGGRRTTWYCSVCIQVLRDESVGY